MGPCVRRDDDRACMSITASQIAASCRRSTCRPAQSRSAASPRVPQSPCSLISNLLSRVQSSFAPPQFSGLSLMLDGAVLAVDGFGEAEDLLRLAGHIGMQALAGIDAVPAAAGHGLAVVGGDRGHDLVRRVVAPGQPGGGRLLHRLDHGGEEILRLHDVGGEPAALQERRQRGLRLRPVDAVDRGGVIARDHQQPLDAGEPRLLVVILGVLGEIGDQVAVVGPRRRDLGERRRRLVRRGTGARRR